MYIYIPLSSDCILRRCMLPDQLISMVPQYDGKMNPNISQF